MLFAGAWAAEQFPVISGTRLTTGEDLFEGHSWTMSVVLLVTVRVGLLSRVCAVFDPVLPTGNVTREPEVAKQLSCMVIWRSAGAADRDVECTVWSRYIGTVIAAHCHHE